MDGIFALIVIIAAIASIAGKAKKANANRPGVNRPGANRPGANPAAGPAPQARPTLMNTIEQIAGALGVDVPTPEARPEPTHPYAPVLNEGESRECAHDEVTGSLGGSMSVPHTEGAFTPMPIQEVQGAAETARREPAIDARDMMRAVVMAEILKRPGERRIGRYTA